MRDYEKEALSGNGYFLSDDEDFEFYLRKRKRTRIIIAAASAAMLLIVFVTLVLVSHAPAGGAASGLRDDGWTAHEAGDLYPYLD